LIPPIGLLASIIFLGYVVGFMIGEVIKEILE
jgi:hypothetical protein